MIFPNTSIKFSPFFKRFLKKPLVYPLTVFNLNFINIILLLFLHIFIKKSYIQGLKLITTKIYMITYFLFHILVRSIFDSRTLEIRSCRILSLLLSDTRVKYLAVSILQTAVPSGARNNRLSENLSYYSVTYP